MDTKGLYQIGEVAKKAGSSIDTIRYYEKEGLLERPVRSDGGFRLYPEKTVEQVRFIQKAKSFGLSLKEIKQITRRSKEGLGPCCDYVSTLLQGKLGELEGKIKELQETRKNLKNLMRHWIPLKEARQTKFAVCPQIERGGNRHGKTKN